MAKRKSTKVEDPAPPPAEAQAPLVVEDPPPNPRLPEQAHAPGELAPSGVIKAICPSCRTGVDDHRCRLCGAVKTVNAVSGNEIWMRNGRVIAAFQDSKQAYLRMAAQWGIPEDRWPEEFRGLKPRSEDEEW